MANNTHGNRNEDNIEQALNGKYYKELTPVLKSFIKDIYPQVKDSTIIKCNTTKGVSKSDLEIYIDEFKTCVSVKEGSGNSVHQEKLEPFIAMLTNQFAISKITADAFSFFIWGDETLDGSGNPSDRMSSKLLQEKYPAIIHEIQSFFDKNKKELLIRFLMTGRFQTGHIDYIYYGTANSGNWASISDIITYHLSLKNNKKLSIGNLTFQAWNRCIKGNAKEKARDTIQLKWASLEKDLENIQQYKNSGYSKENYEGVLGEFNLARELNKNTNSEHWKVLQTSLKLDSLTNVFAVKVNNKVNSNLINKLVYSKTDVYLVKSSAISDTFLMEYNYALDENLLQKHSIDYQFINMSGISVKKKTSSQYTIHKFSPTSFYATFGSNILAAGASIFCKNENELHKNMDVLNGWGVNVKDFFSFFNINTSEKEWITNHLYIDRLKTIKVNCNNEIKRLILNDGRISDTIFKGDFNEPYRANFVYKNGLLELNNPCDFYITTGSGRSHGDYSIIVKPN